MRERKVGELVMDFSVYPRMDVDPQHLSYVKEAILAGVKMPPVVICQKTLRVSDGFHRTKNYLSIYGPDHVIEVIEKRYKNDAELLEDAIRYNANHGRPLTRYDRVHCILIGEKLQLSPDAIASAMGMTTERLAELRSDRVGKMLVPGKKSEVVPLKRTIAHMTGRTLTAEQGEANKKLSGMNQLFYVNQVILLIESGLLDQSNVDLMERLGHLARIIREGAAKVAA